MKIPTWTMAQYIAYDMSCYCYEDSPQDIWDMMTIIGMAIDKGGSTILYVEPNMEQARVRWS